MSYRQGYRPQTQTPRQAQQRASAPRAASTKRRTQAVASTRAKANKRKRSRPIGRLILLVVLALAVVGGVMVYRMYDEVARIERLNTFYPEVYVNGVPLYGASPQEAYNYLVSQAHASLDSWAITLEYQGSAWRIDASTLGMDTAVESAVQEEVNKAFYVGREGSFLDRYNTIVALKEEPYQAYTSGVEKNMAPIDSIVSEIQAAVYKAPQNASSSFDATRKTPLMVIDGTAGQELDAVALKERIVEMVNNMESGTIQVQPTPIQPQVSASTINGELMLIARAETTINRNSTEERNMNIERGLQAFNGKTVKAGDRVSFNRWVGRRTAKNGFYEAQEIVSGSYEMGIGGGICQVSSTLYNAVIQANLKVVDRTNHGIPVNYMEMGADATVADDRYDFVFENNTGADIYLVAKIEGSGNKKTCVFEIYGRPDPNGYTYSLRHEQIEEIPIPDPVYEIDYEGLYGVTFRDEEHIAFEGSTGHVVKTYLVVRDSKGTVVEEKELYTDTYKARAPKIYRGVTKRDI